MTMPPTRTQRDRTASASRRVPPTRPPRRPGRHARLRPALTPGRHVSHHYCAGRPKVRRVHLRAHPPTPPQRPDGLVSDADWDWATSAPRRWDTITSRFPGRAGEIARALALAGCVVLDHDYRNGTICQPPRRWVPDPGLAAGHATGQQARRSAQQALRKRAGELRDLLAAQWPGAARAVDGHAPQARLEWIVRACEDLVVGRSHDGPRAFVQHHVGNTKAREDLPRLLADAGFEPEALAVLGINRNPYIGIGGPVRARRRPRLGLGRLAGPA